MSKLKDKAMALQTPRTTIEIKDVKPVIKENPDQRAIGKSLAKDNSQTPGMSR